MVAVGVLAWDHFDRIPGAAIWISVATVGAVVLRLWLSFRENANVEKVRSDSAPTPSPGSPIAEPSSRLSDELMREQAGPALLVIFDLDGFKSFNDSFGHSAGDRLLRRMGGGLACSVAGRRAYRLGGDEFCVLARTNEGRFLHVLAAARAALTEHGEGFESPARAAPWFSTWSLGHAEAMRIAEARMYEEKGLRASSAERQTREVLMRILREREPEVSQHLQGVATSRRTSAGASTWAPRSWTWWPGRQLHDVGKVGIPDRSSQAWPARRRRVGPDPHPHADRRAHPARGACMAPVSRVVRSSHERWDGGGYPDGLKGGRSRWRRGSSPSATPTTR